MRNLRGGVFPRSLGSNWSDVWNRTSQLVRNFFESQSFEAHRLDAKEVRWSSEKVQASKRLPLGHRWSWNLQAFFDVKLWNIIFSNMWNFTGSEKMAETISEKKPKTVVFVTGQSGEVCRWVRVLSCWCFWICSAAFPRDFEIQKIFVSLRFLEMPWLIWWTSFKPLRPATLKLLWCWSSNRRQVWKSESTSSNWHCTWISHLFKCLTALWRLEGNTSYDVNFLANEHTSLDIIGWNLEICGVRPHPVSKAMEPFGVLQDQCLDCMVEIVSDGLVRWKTCFWLATLAQNFGIQMILGLQNACEARLELRTSIKILECSEESQVVCAQESRICRAHSEMFFQLDGCLQSWGEWAECNLSISRAGDDGWYYAGRTFHFALVTNVDDIICHMCIIKDSILHCSLPVN